MKAAKVISIVCLCIFLASSVFAQDNMMKEDKTKKMMDDKKEMKMQDESKKADDMMKKDKMMEDNMHSDMMMVNKDEMGVAIKGYDPVAYFTASKPVMGMKKYSAMYNGAEWHFASMEHKEMFEKNPEMYAPQFGGFCSLGLADGHCAPADPTAWKIVDNKLYLNSSIKAAEKWEKDINGNIKKGTEGWMKENSKN